MSILHIYMLRINFLTKGFPDGLFPSFFVSNKESDFLILPEIGISGIYVATGRFYFS